MLGYSYTVRRINDAEVEKKLDETADSDARMELYNTQTLAKWDTAGYNPRWPDALVDEGLAEADHQNILLSVFQCSLKYVLRHLSQGMQHEGPTIIQEDGIITEPGDVIRPTIYHDRIAKCDLEEIVVISRWDMS